MDEERYTVIRKKRGFFDDDEVIVIKRHPSPLASLSAIIAILSFFGFYSTEFGKAIMKAHGIVGFLTVWIAGLLLIGIAIIAITLLIKKRPLVGLATIFGSSLLFSLYGTMQRIIKIYGANRFTVVCITVLASASALLLVKRIIRKRSENHTSLDPVNLSAQSNSSVLDSDLEFENVDQCAPLNDSAFLEKVERIFRNYYSSKYKIKQGKNDCDLIMFRGTKPFVVVQIKKWHLPEVTTRPLRELRTVMEDMKVPHGCLVTNRQFSSPQIAYAQENNIKLIDPEKLDKMRQSLT